MLFCRNFVPFFLYSTGDDHRNGLMGYDVCNYFAGNNCSTFLAHMLLCHTTSVMSLIRLNLQGSQDRASARSRPAAAASQGMLQK